MEKKITNNFEVDLRVDYPIFFQDEASNVWLLMQACHWFIWIFLVFILVFVLIMFILILLDSSTNMKYTYSYRHLAFRYMHLKGSKIVHLSNIEFIWTTLPCFFLLAIGTRSIYTLYLIDAPLGVDIVVKALGRQWFWQYEVTTPVLSSFSNIEKFYFDSYLVILNEQEPTVGDLRNLKVDTMLSLVVGLPVRFITTGMDVLHSFAVPALGIKIDAVPGRLNSADVILERHGVYYGQCSELCGQGHGYMPIAVYVQSIQL